MFQHMNRFQRRRNVTEMKTSRRRMRVCGKLHSNETERSVSCFTHQIVSWRCNGYNKTDNFRFSSSLVITRDSSQGLNCPSDRVGGCSSFQTFSISFSSHRQPEQMVRIVHIPPSISCWVRLRQATKAFFFPTTSLSPSEGGPKKKRKIIFTNFLFSSSVCLMMIKSLIVAAYDGDCVM